MPVKKVIKKNIRRDTREYDIRTIANIIIDKKQHHSLLKKLPFQKR